MKVFETGDSEVDSSNLTISSSSKKKMKGLSQYISLESEERQQDNGNNMPVPESIVSWADSETPSASPNITNHNGHIVEKLVPGAHKSVPSNKWSSVWGLPSVSM